ncbi:DUF1003 domain-containing protein [Brevibacterium sp. 50QC2O2]|uniref:DUF1003 domain-containing protein n=1 Tax=Brevibacterium sp. 50QC2O2 TaxID=2968459 RepID=UPI00211B884D|nr:DUF1003 domain-containing protein [Brevibacterium sp. 50QC2O2]MCQ9387515.1 DUF1003 domain-containing protein [Brevibacterium sp. 50QC2O2]
MAEDERKAAQPNSLDTPRSKGRGLPRLSVNPDMFGRIAEAIARFMGTPAFLFWMTVICAVWLGWNSLAPEEWQFDPRAMNFTLLTLILSLQASYAAPLLLLADNRSADRDRIEFENDRRRDERHLADTEYLMREMSSLRIAMRDMAGRDFIRSELRDLLEEIETTHQETVTTLTREYEERITRLVDQRTGLADALTASGGDPDRVIADVDAAAAAAELEDHGDS